MGRTVLTRFMMVMTTAVLCLAAGGSLSAQALIWSASYGGGFTEEGHAGARTSDGGYVTLGSTYSFGAGDHDIYVLRLDSLGDTLWTGSYGGPAADYGHDIQATSDGGFIVVGATHSFGSGSSDVYLIKLDFMGGEVWSQTFGGADRETGYSVRETSDGGFIVAGGCYSFGAGYEDFYLVRTDANGNLRWQRTYGGSGGEAAFAVRQTFDGGFAACGATGSFGSGYSSVYTVRLDADGDTVWTATYGGNRADMGHSLEVTPDGGLILVGATASSGAGEYDIYLIKTDPTGTVEWEQTYGGNRDDRGYSIGLAADGGYLVAGITSSFGQGQVDAIAIKTNPVGTTEWQQTYGGTQSDYCRAVIADDGAWILVGYTFSFGAGSSDIFLTKIAGDQATAVPEELAASLPTNYTLEQNYPNPFNQATTIEFSTAVAADVSLTIYNVLGQAVRKWPFGYLSPGYQAIRWDGYNDWSLPVASGVYFYTVRVDDTHLTRKMILLK